MSYATGTTHYNLPQTAGTDKRDWSDTNQAFANVDAALYQASQDATTAIGDAATAQSTANTAIADAAAAQSSADAAAASASTAGELAQHVSVELGTLANLTTTDKSSAVAAINEVNSDLIGNLKFTSSTSGTFGDKITALKAVFDTLTFEQKLSAKIVVGDSLILNATTLTAFGCCHIGSTSPVIDCINLANNTYKHATTVDGNIVDYTSTSNNQTVKLYVYC